MSSDALRQVFAEFGFKVDSAKLDGLDKLVRETADHLRDATVANTNFDKALQAAKGPKDSIASLKTLIAEQKAAADKRKTFTGFLEGKRDDAAERMGESAARAIPPLRALTERLGMTNTELGRFIMGATAAGGALAALGLHAAFAFGREFAAGAEQLRDTARESRVTTSELQGLDHAAVQAGVGVERMRSGLHTFGEGLRTAERWGNGTTSTLRRLGITTRDAAGHIRPTTELLDEVAVAMERVENPYRRARVAQQLFGESGRRMLDVLHTGPGGIRALREELEELGGGVTPEAVEASRQFTQAQERQGRAMDSLRSVLATSLLPALSWFMNLTARAAGELSKLTRGTHVADIALGALGVAGAAAAALVIAAWAPAVAPFVLVAAGVGLLGVALDDVVGFMEGKDSVVGRFIDKVFGEGKSVELVEALRGSWQGVRDLFNDLEAVVARVSGKFDELRNTAQPVLSRIEQAMNAVGLDSAASVARAIPATVAAPAALPILAARAALNRGEERTGVQVGAAPQVTAPAPATITVPVAGFAGAERPARAVSKRVTNHNTFHLAGPDARQLAAQVGQILERQQQEQRDADHPQEDEE